MSRDKQIEEMVKIMNNTCNVYDEQGNHIRNKCYECECWSDDNHCCCSYNSKEAEALYNAGYRKADEVVREIADEIKAFQDQLSSRTAQYEINSLIFKLEKSINSKKNTRKARTRNEQVY